MPKSFSLPAIKLKAPVPRGSRFTLQVIAAALGVANLIALGLYFFPPGGSRDELSAQGESLRRQVAAARVQSTRLKKVASKVELGSEQATGFEGQYILARRAAYEAVIAEIQRMAKEANLVERDGVFSEEPIEGTADLSLLNMTANYQGNYQSLMKFLYEADHSPLLLMLDALQASPQKGDQINTSIRFQAIIRDETAPPAALGGQP